MLVVQYISSGHLSWIKWNMLDASFQNGGSHSLSRALSISVVARPTKIITGTCQPMGFLCCCSMCTFWTLLTVDTLQNVRLSVLIYRVSSFLSVKLEHNSSY